MISRFPALIRHNGFRPAVSATLIAVALVFDHMLQWETLSDLFMVLATLIVGIPILRTALRALQIKVIGIDLLVSIAAIGAIVIGEYWEAAAVTFLFALGHVLESATLAKTRSSLAALIEVAPDVATVLREGKQIQVAARHVKVGEIVVVKHGEKVPVDGEVVAGNGSIDEASITGESIPAEKSAGDRAFAGTVSHSGLLQIRTTGAGADTTLARIIHRVEEAQDAKAKTALFMDRFAKWYTPGIILGSLVAGLVTQDVTLGLTLLVIGCPGALVISIPVAIVAGIGRAARDGILIKGGEYLETTARVDTVALDKTGTLTEGRPVIREVRVLGTHASGSSSASQNASRSDHSDLRARRSGPGILLPTSSTDVITWAARAEAGSSHPLALPILNEATDRGVAPTNLPESTEIVPGKGVIATHEGTRILVGNRALLESFAITDTESASVVMDELAALGQTPVAVAVGEAVIGVIGLADVIRPDAESLVHQLHRVGVSHVLMLTGDAPRVAEAVGTQLGIDEIQAGLLPEDKLTAVQSSQAQGRTVAMVGDGVNDAPALAIADIGVAMGAAGSAVAVETADIALMSNSLSKLPEAIWLAKRTVRTMRENIVIALATVGLLLLGVLFGGVTMSIGMLVHEASVLVVIVNAMRLLRRKDFSQA